MSQLERFYETMRDKPSDINMFIPKLREYAEKCEHITEFGVRWIVSTWGLLAGKPKKMISYDIADPSNWNANINDVYDVAKENNIDYKFIIGDTHKIEIEETDLLFIDTEHTYEHLKKELELHHSKVKKYLAFHDTVSYPGVKKAIDEFLINNIQWEIEYDDTNWPGFLILIKK